MKNDLILNYTELAKKNYDRLKHYFTHQPHHFLPLTSLRNEILQNLLLDLNQTAIFGINHLLERMIKLSLIEKYTLGLNYSDHKLYNEKTIEAVNLYDNLTLFESLKSAKDRDLISESENDTLTKLRKNIRNPFSHAEIKKIMNEAPPMFTGFMFNMNDIKESLIKGKPIKVGEKKELTTFSPTISQLYQNNYSEQIAFDYFKTVYDILINIDKRLMDMKNALVK